MPRKVLLYLLMLITALLAGACAIPAPTTAPAENAAQVIDSYAKPDVLVDTEWVKAHLDDPSVRLIDVSNADAYAAGHLPGALHAPLGQFTNPDDPVQGQILTRDALTALFSGLGINHDDTVVFYDNNANLLSTRAYWAVKYYQHDDVRVYNGGSQKWTADGEALATDAPPAPAATAYVASEADPAIRTTWEYVVEQTENPETLFCDTRGPEEYLGTDVRADRGGHIPGAINVEWRNAVNEDGTFRAAADLADLYQKAVFVPEKQIITYCQTGVRGAHTWFVLRELLGYPDVRNYDGSWEEYGNNEASVIE
ncbi:MAG: sulfurtransferase [Caldilineaceae bacterium]|nr:sulfurtransferase [Caldilineaceae bacterium]